ncbi:MAG: DinB family protein [Bacteroidetes bacterium]|nr:DinB family protein [Bacteroidota bacterium]
MEQIMNNFEIDILDGSRNRLKNILDDVSEKVLLTIPDGFNNNILWHIGHCVVSQQRLMYMRSGLPMNISDEYHDNFKIGTSPNNWVKTPDIVEIRESLIATAEQLKEDLEKEIFQEYTPFVIPSMGFEIKNHLDGLVYANFHEAGHTGNIQYLMRIINME